MENRLIRVCRYDSPCGALLLGAFGHSLCLCDWLGSPHHPRVISRLKRLLRAELRPGSDPVLEDAAVRLDGYFSCGKVEVGIPLLTAGTVFQTKVWDALKDIVPGTTVSYSSLACAIGAAGSVRAVASAVGANALSIFLPCHRVISGNGSLAGYAGGLKAKRHMLALEGSVIS